mgnify:FL=1
MPRVTGLITYNQLFLRGFDFLAPYPTTAGEVFFARLVVPVRLLRY